MAIHTIGLAVRNMMRCGRAMALSALLLPSTAFGQSNEYGQFAPPDAFENGSKLAYYGSENEWSRRQFEASEVAEQPNRLGQRLILAIQDGHPDVAAKWCQEYLAKDPQQLEALFALGIAQAQLG